MTEPTIPKIHIKEIPTSPLTPLDIERKDPYVNGEDYEVLFEGEVIGTIPGELGWRDRTLRWHDVLSIVTASNKRTRNTLTDHEKSLALFDKLPYNKVSKPSFFTNPFPHGSDTIEELAMTGADNFKHSYQLYNHWFNISPLDRLNREMSNFDPTKLNTDDLKTVEKKLKALWVESHGTLMKRVSGP